MLEVLTEVQGRVGVITLNRPERLNAWNKELQTQLYDALESFASDNAVRCIVVTGAGRAFCSGADLRSAAISDAGNSTDKRTPLLTKSINKPVIAALNGATIGVGLAFALCCDIRFADKNAKIMTAFSKRGLIAEFATSWTLPHLVGIGAAMRLMLSSEVIDGREAHRLGLVQEVCDGDVLERALAFATNLAENVSPVSMAVMKMQLWDHPLRTPEVAMAQSTRLMMTSVSKGNSDCAEGITSWLEKRKADFEPLDAKNPVMRMADVYFNSKL
eukprot:m.788167 g.788167  ORF g.788167 m.788167 type:complete len:273 (+) comp23314_c0_seq4:90-908(+)